MRRILYIVLSLFSCLALQAQTRADYFLMEAGKYRMRREWSTAMMLYRHALAVSPQSAESMYQLGRMYYYIREDSIGEKYMLQAIGTDSTNTSYLESMAAIYLRTNRAEKALPLLERMSALEPRRTDVLSHLSGYYADTGQLEDAIKTLDRWETLEGKMPQLSYEKYSLYNQLGDSIRAFNELETLCDEFPSDMTHRVRMGYQYQQHGNLKRAIQIYDEVRNIEPHNPQLQVAMLDYYEALGQKDRAVAIRDSIMSDVHADRQVRMGLMQNFVQSQIGNPNGDSLVADRFDRILSVDTANVELMGMYAAYMSYSEKPDSLICPIMQRVLRVEPDNDMATQWLLQYFARRQEFASLEEICRRGANYHPENLAYHYFLGMTFSERGNDSGAVEIWKKGLRQRSSEASGTLVSDVFTALGDLYFKTGDVRESYCAYDSALVYNKDNILALNNYAYFLSLRRENLDKAEQMSYRTIKAEPENKTYLDTYAWILFMRGDYAEAAHYMDRVVSPDSTGAALLADPASTSVILEHAADIAWFNGDTGRACYLWDLAVRLGDEDVSAVLLKKSKKRKYLKK